MIENSKDLTASEIARLLGKLDVELERRGQRVVLYVVGGANISLALDARRSTKDIDAVVKRGFDVVFDAAKEVAKSETGLGADWLNSDFTGGTPDGGLSWSWMDNKDDDTPSVAFSGKALNVELASPEMMLALKILAGRDKDLADIYLLMRKTGIKTPNDVGKNLTRFSGRRIFDQQGATGMPFHIDPRFAYVFDNAPDDLRPPDPDRKRNWWGVFRRDKPANPASEGHRGKHLYRRSGK